MPRRKSEPLDLDADLMKACEQGIRAVLADNRCKPSERMQAIQAGIRLLQVRHKIEGEADGTGSFFKSAE